MKLVPVILICTYLISNVYGEVGKRLECDPDLKDHPHFKKCCNEDYQTTKKWGADIELDYACECSQFLQLDNMINYWDIHFCQSRYVAFTHTKCIKSTFISIFYALQFRTIFLFYCMQRSSKKIKKTDIRSPVDIGQI